MLTDHHNSSLGNNQHTLTTPDWDQRSETSPFKLKCHAVELHVITERGPTTFANTPHKKPQALSAAAAAAARVQGRRLILPQVCSSAGVVSQRKLQSLYAGGNVKRSVSFLAALMLCNLQTAPDLKKNDQKKTLRKASLRTKMKRHCRQRGGRARLASSPWPSGENTRRQKKSKQ